MPIPLPVLPIKLRNLAKQFSRFATVGVLATLLHSLVALTTIRVFEFSGTEANVSAFLSATLVSYTLNSLWSFESRIHWHSLARFFVVGLLNLGMIVLLSQLNDHLGLPPETSVLLVIMTMPMINFSLHKVWTFKSHQSLR